MKILITSLILFSCSATHLTKPTKPKYAPEGYNPIGAVKYLNQGLDSIIKQRREDAFRKMNDQCDGKYKVTKEYASQSNTGIDVSSYWIINYSCK